MRYGKMDGTVGFRGSNRSNYSLEGGSSDGGRGAQMERFFNWVI
jgi:hypothetical protein